MFTSRKPTHLMIDSIDHYRETTADERDQAGGEVKDYTLAQAGIPCKWDDKTANPFEEYMQRDILEQPCMYLCDGNAYALVTEGDLMLFRTNWYRVQGKHDQMMLGRVFRIDLQSVTTPSFSG